VSFAEPKFRTHEHDVDERTAVIAVEGEIHVSTAPDFTNVLNAVIDAGRTWLVLDLAGVMFIDSTGLSVLLNALRRVMHAGGGLVLACRNPTVLRLFEITKLDATFALHDDRDAALLAVRAAQAQAAAGASDAGAP
jgi:anti-sigma B factor antagonist